MCLSAWRGVSWVALGISNDNYERVVKAFFSFPFLCVALSGKEKGTTGENLEVDSCN